MSPATTPPRVPRSTRDRPAKPPLSLDGIVDAALAIVKSEGLDALSMRRVAGVLDTAAASLYVYVAGREGLLEAVIDRIIATIELEPPDPDRWREQLHTLLGRMRAALVTYPGIAAATMIDPPKTEVVMGLLENLFGLLLAGGLTAQDAAWTADILAAQVTYSAIEAGARHMQSQELADEVSTNLARLPAGRFPLLTAHVEELVAGDVEGRFHFAIDVVLDGIAVRQEG
jgi:AcrR family transcriptional regulator